MNRRNAIRSLFALGVSMTPFVARAQSSSKVWLVGYLGPSADTAPHLLKAFQDRLVALG